MLYDIILGSFSEYYNGIVKDRAFICIILVGISAFSCQLLKLIITSIRHKKVMWRSLFSTGGFPSSHSSSVITLVISLGIFEMHDVGGLDYSFAVAATVAFIVIHDSMGVRLEASKHAKILNNMVENEPLAIKQELGFGRKGHLKELLGHKFVEVFAGIIYGVLVAIIGTAIVL